MNKKNMNKEKKEKIHIPVSFEEVTAFIPAPFSRKNNVSGTLKAGFNMEK